MIRSFMYREGDYVKYLGNLQVAAGPLRESGVGVITEFEEFEGTERIYLFLSDRNSHIWCDYDKLRPIETEEKHLLASGFNLEMVEKRKRFRRGVVFVSRAMIMLYQFGQYISTGFCIGDLTGGILIDKYIHEDKFNIIEFYDDYPSVNNINDFITFLKSSQIELDWPTIVSL